MKYDMHNRRVRGDFSQPPYGTTTIAVIESKNENCRSLKSKEKHKKESSRVGLCSFGKLTLVSDPLRLAKYNKYS